MRSLYRHLLNVVEAPFGGESVTKKFIWASGSSSVLMIGIDRSKVSDERQFDVFRNFIGGENQHWTPIAEREVTDDAGRRFHFVALQMTGGGNFPTRYISADIIINLLATTEKMFDLRNKQDAITYDLVQTRGCGRAVSAKNAISFLSLGRGAMGSYALGGIGMTTAYSNGELLNELLELREMVADGRLTLEQMDEILASGNMTTPSVERLYGVKEVLYGVNYHKLVDDQRRAARKLGRDDSLSRMEKYTHAALLASVLLLLLAFLRRSRRSRHRARRTRADMTLSGMASQQQQQQQQTRHYGRYAVVQPSAAPSHTAHIHHFHHYHRHYRCQGRQAMVPLPAPIVRISTATLPSMSVGPACARLASGLVALGRRVFK